MAIECQRCGGPTMLETIIKLRRGLLGFRETRSPGAYCATCKLSVPLENPAATRPSITIHGRPRPRLAGFLPMWLRIAPARSEPARATRPRRLAARRIRLAEVMTIRQQT